MPTTTYAPREAQRVAEVAGENNYRRYRLDELLAMAFADSPSDAEATARSGASSVAC